MQKALLLSSTILQLMGTTFAHIELFVL